MPSVSNPLIMRSLVFAPLTILPFLALIRVNERVDFRYIVGYLVAISLVTLVAYRTDKRRAERQRWRIPESTLHIFELAGGWMAAYWAQVIFRHKTRKGAYQFTFWAIGLVHQYLAFDFLTGGQVSNQLIQYGKAAFGTGFPGLI